MIFALGKFLIFSYEPHKPARTKEFTAKAYKGDCYSFICILSYTITQIHKNSTFFLV